MRRDVADRFCRLAAVVTFLPLLLIVIGVPRAQAESSPPALITQNVDESKLVTLSGNTRPETTSENDRGRVDDSFPLEHMLLQLKRSAEKEKELERLIDELHDSSSPNFHHWLTAKEFGKRFGLARQDLDTIKGWLQSHGFKVNVVYENGLLIDFSGTAGEVREAFHTEIHQLKVKGEKHLANMSDPKMPAALAPAVTGIVSLHDFMPHTMHNARPDYTIGNGTYYAVTPPDLATIYNFNPLFAAGISGQGQTIALIEDSDVYTTADWTAFRSTFGLSSYTGGTLTQVNPAPLNGVACSDPGYNGNGVEAILDAEYASAAAPSAAILLATCADSETTFGGLIALQNLLDASSAPPAQISISYGECEAYNGAASNAAYYSVYQQGVAEGSSIFVSTGDSGALGCFLDYSGIGVSGLASTPYNVAVGGTDFGDTFAKANSTYWSPTNSPTYGSALSYIPEIPWNESCASVLVARSQGYKQTYGSSGFCNDANARNFLNLGAASGGPSGCATGSPTTFGVVGGTCAGWPKPAWQSLFGNHKDGVRDLPDVSLFAANAPWGHYYPICWSDWFDGGVDCSQPPSNWPGFGGTSFASPIMAGIQALVTQKAGGRQGNPNPAYYSLAAREYGTGGSSSCNSNLGNTVGSQCIFYDVTKGDIDLPCAYYNGSSSSLYNCYLPSGSYGVFSTSNTSYNPAYRATNGWDFATGIGSVNAANLVNNWPAPTTPTFTLSAWPYNLAVTQGSSGQSTVTLIALDGFTGSVTLSLAGLPSGVTATFGTNPLTSTSILTFNVGATATPGTFPLTITGTSGTLTKSTTMHLIVNAMVPSFSLTSSPSAVSVVQGGVVRTTVTVVPTGGFSAPVKLIIFGLPQGVTASFSPAQPTATSVLTLKAGSAAATGTVTLTIGGTSGRLSAATTVTLTVNPFGDFSLTASPKTLTVARGGSGTSTITINPTDGFDQKVTLKASGLPAGVTASISPDPATSTCTLTLKIGKSAASGTSAITITGTSGSRRHTTTVKLTVTT